MTQEELDALLNDGTSEQQTQEDIQPDTEELPQKDQMPSKFRIE